MSNNHSDSRGIFYGWYVLVVCGIAMGTAAGLGSTFSVFFKPLLEEFGWTRTQLSGPVSLNMVVAGLAGPLWGFWTDKAGARRVLILGASFLGLVLLLLRFMGTLWHVYVLFSFFAFFASAIAVIPMTTAVSQWFERRRGLAIGIAMAGDGVGFAVMPIVATYLVLSVGWRSSYTLLALLVLAVLIPLGIFVMRGRPQDLGLLPDGATPEAEDGTAPAPATSGHEQGPDSGATGQQDEEGEVPGLTVGQAIKTLPFWMIAAGFFLPMVIVGAILVHLIPMLTDMGLSAETAGWTLGLLGALGIVGRFGYGIVADRLGARRAYIICYIFDLVGVCMLLGTKFGGLTAVYAFIVVFGLTYAGGFTLAPLIIGECFGLKSMGAIFGVLGIPAMVGSAIGPLLAAQVFDRTGSYYPAFVVFSIFMALAIIAISQAKPAISPQAVSQE